LLKYPKGKEVVVAGRGLHGRGIAAPAPQKPTPSAYNIPGISEKSSALPCELFDTCSFLTSEESLSTASFYFPDCHLGAAIGDDLQLL